MKLQIETSVLRQMLSTVGANKGRSSKKVTEAYGLVSLEVAEDKLIAHAYDFTGHIWTEHYLGKDAEADGFVLVEYEPLSRIVNNISAERLYLDTDVKGTLTIRYDDNHARLLTRSTFFEPTLPFPDEPDATIKIDGHDLKAALAFTVGCVDVKHVRPAFQCVYFKVSDGGSLEASGTDTHTLRRYKTESESLRVDAPEGEVAILIPHEVVWTIIRLVGAQTQAVIKLANKRLYLESGLVKAALATNVMDKFPDCTRLLDDTDMHCVQCSYRSLMEVASRAASMIKEQDIDIELQLIEEPPLLKLRFGDQINSVVCLEAIAMRSIRYQQLKAKFWAKQLSLPEALAKAIEDVDILYTDGQSRVMIRPSDEKIRHRYVSVIMPHN